MKIEGTLYKFIVKGRRSLDKFDGLYKQQSHLIYGWFKRGATEEENEWAWCYSWEKEDGSGEGRLGKGWRRVAIWRDYPGGVKAWIDDLSHQRLFPRHVDALAQVFPQALPVERRADEVEHWKRQVIAQETRVAELAREVNQMAAVDLGDSFKDYLDSTFPQYTHSCSSFSGCPMIPICWEGAKAEVGDLYQIRLQNHPEKETGDEG